MFAPVDLERGESLLLEVALLFERDGTLHRAADLDRLLDADTEQFEPALTIEIVKRLIRNEKGAVSAHDWIGNTRELGLDPETYDSLRETIQFEIEQARLNEIGEFGEELVEETAKAELTSLGRNDLAAQVRRVSLESDRFGFDVLAPRIGRPPRLLEVKATVRKPVASVLIHISRNEYETGQRSNDWSLSVCHVRDLQGRVGEILGWCLGSELQDITPDDSKNSRWESSEIEIPLGLLRSGLPSAV